MSGPELIPPAGAVAPPPPPRYTVFRGPSGIRAGWRVLIFVALAGILLIVSSVIVGLFVRGRNPQMSQLSPLGTFVSEGAILFLTVIPALIMARIERRKFGDYGLPVKHAFQKNFWIGSLGGFLAISLTLLVIFALHGFQITGLGIHGNTILLATAAWSGAFVVVGLAEEFAFRGYLQYTLTTGMGFWPSAILLSALFALAHSRNPGESTGGLLSIVVFALVFCFLLRRSGDLWLAVGFHAGWDWGQTFFYGVPDSGLMPYHNLFNSAFSGPRWLTGGTVGPEASVFTPIVLVLVAVVFSRIYRQNRYPASALDPQAPPFGP
jgi:membrane protease YdiL (CAAX protease family)